MKSKYLDFVCIFYHVFWNLLRILKCNYVFIQSSLITGLKFKKLENFRKFIKMLVDNPISPV